MSLSLPRHQRAHGRAELGFIRTDRGTVLRHLFHAAPLRVLFPRPEPDDLPLAALVNVGGGLAGGDSLEISARLAESTGASLTTPAAEKVYRSLGESTRLSTELEVAEGATLEWLPQETILFDGARLERRMRARLAPGARLLAAEMLVFGRVARGERLSHGALFDSWRLWRGERLHWADAMDLSGDIAARLAAPFGFAQAEASALLLLAGSEAEAGAGRDLLREAGHDATLARPGLLLVRWLGRAGEVRDALSAAIPLLRAGVLGHPARLPRLWTS
ncbi:urease accessory protein UreD [Roseomonas marmotae]|uniref:Urease accessory protein UreD n=1 Tax=Roseomonas marmotae TaxID=2768161 RepID=A0ABS3KDS4_9PROT|nr:urease accessory protein UreD [Roseomonas marmotae]MBO1075629.1 urease accessory protein UreD [Roseomonas marmotae]QTI79490.1 urease accessory protein UreD [Roseomonas marmotae]